MANESRIHLERQQKITKDEFECFGQTIPLTPFVRQTLSNTFISNLHRNECIEGPVGNCQRFTAIFTPTHQSAGACRNAPWDL